MHVLYSRNYCNSELYSWCSALELVFVAALASRSQLRCTEAVALLSFQHSVTTRVTAVPILLLLFICLLSFLPLLQALPPLFCLKTSFGNKLLAKRQRFESRPPPDTFHHYRWPSTVSMDSVIMSLLVISPPQIVMHLIILDTINYSTNL